MRCRLARSEETEAHPRARPSPSALHWPPRIVVALAGTSYAAANLPARSVGTTQLKKGAVGAKQLKNLVRHPAQARSGATNAVEGPEGRTGATGQQGSQGQNGSADAPQQVLGKLAQVDGNGSGLDAETIHGVDPPEIAKVVGDLTLENFNFGPIAAGRCGQISTNGLQVPCRATSPLNPYERRQTPGRIILTGGGVEAPSNGEAISATTPPSMRPDRSSMSDGRDPVPRAQDRVWFPAHSGEISSPARGGQRNPGPALAIQVWLANFGTSRRRQTHQGNRVPRTTLTALASCLTTAGTAPSRKWPEPQERIASKATASNGTAAERAFRAPSKGAMRRSRVNRLDRSVGEALLALDYDGPPAKLATGGTDGVGR